MKNYLIFSVKVFMLKEKWEKPDSEVTFNTLEAA